MVDYDVNGWQKLGSVVRDVRRDRGLSQHALADKAGVSRAWLARFESGHRGAAMEQVFRVLAALDLTFAVRTVERPVGEQQVLTALAERSRRHG